jgi:hypothetical protein
MILRSGTQPLGDDGSPQRTGAQFIVMVDDAASATSQVHD